MWKFWHKTICVTFHTNFLCNLELARSAIQGFYVVVKKWPWLWTFLQTFLRKLLIVCCTLNINYVFPPCQNIWRMWPSKLIIAASPRSPPLAPRCSVSLQYHPGRENTLQDTCLLNRNDVFRIGQRVRPIFFNSGYLIGSGDMCPQIKSIYFLVLST